MGESWWNADVYYAVSTNALFFCSTARLRGVHDGLFTGQIDAVDTSAATYRVTFDRTGLGTHTVPDYEVLVRFAYWHAKNSYS